MSFNDPYRQHVYMGHFSTDGDALTFIQTAHWDSSKDGLGDPEGGMLYYNKAMGKFRYYSETGWKTLEPGIIFQDNVLDQLNTPPALPATGARYLIDTVPTGAWIGHANAIAEYEGVGWIFTEAAEGMALWIEDVNLAYRFNGTSWVPMPSSSNHNDLLGIQGGAVGDYYHLTNVQHTDLTDGGTTSLHAHTLDQGYDAGGAGAGRSITADSGSVSISVPNTANTVVLQLTQSDTTNNPAVLSIANAGTGSSINLDGTTRSIVSSTGKLTISTVTSGTLELTGAGLVDLNAGANLDVDVTGTMDFLSTGTFSVDGTGNSNVTTTSGNLTISTLTSGALGLSSAGLLDIDAAANLDVDVTGTVDVLSTGTFSIDGTGASNISSTSGNLTVSTLTAGTLFLTSAGLMDVDAASNLDMDVTGTIAVDATSTISVDGIGNCNMSATSGNLTLSTITSGTLELTSANLIDVNAAANLDVDVTGTIDILATSTFSIDGTGASNVSTTSGNLTLSTITSGTLELTSAALVDLNAGANLDMDITGTVDMLASSTMTLAATGNSSIGITSGNLTLSTGTSGDVLLNAVANVQMTANSYTAGLYSSGFFGIGTNAPSSFLDVHKAGTPKAIVDFLELTNTANAADMDGTGLGILFKQYYYDAGSPNVADAGRIVVVSETDWTSTASTQDAYMAFYTSLDGTVGEKLRLTSVGDLGLGSIPSAVLDLQRAGTVKATTNFIELTNSGNAADMDGTGTAILFNQFYYHASTPAVVSAGKIVVGTETDWTSSIGTQDAYMSFHTVLNSTLTEWMRIASYGSVGIGTVAPSSLLDLQKSGSVKTNTDILEITNSGNAVDMDGTSTGIVFNQYYYDASTPAVVDAGRILVATETDWTSSAASQDSYMALQTALGGDVAERMRITSGGNVGIGAQPSARLDVQQAGTVKASTNLLELTNSGNAADMDGTATAILFNQYYYDVSTPAPVNAAKIAAGTETDWTSTASTQDAYLSFSTGLDGSLTEYMRIRSSGNIGMGITSPTTLLNLQRAGTVKTNLDILKLSNSVNAADMDGTQTSILFGQYYYDIAVPSVASSGRITVGTETDWTVVASTQDSYMSFATALDGAVAEKMRITSSGYVGINNINPTARLDVYQSYAAGTYGASANTKYLGTSLSNAAIVGSSTIFTGEYSYMSCAAQITGTTYLRNFWSNIRFEDTATGTLAHVRNYDSSGEAGASSTATITSWNHFVARNVTLLGGTITYQYGLYVSDLTSASNNFGVYTAGTTKSYFGGNVGIGVETPSVALDIQRAGTVKATTDLLELTNSGNAVDMDGTGTGIVFNQYYYDAATPAVADAGRIVVGTETDWTSTASTQDSFMSFQTCLDGVVAEKIRLSSTGYLGIGIVPSAPLHIQVGTVQQNLYSTSNVDTVIWFGSGIGGSAKYGHMGLSYSQNAMYLSYGGGSSDRHLAITASGIGMGTVSPSSQLDVQKAGTAKVITDIIELTNSGNAADMDGTGTAILFNQFYYDASTPAVADAGRIVVATETDWTSTASTQDSFLALHTCLDGTVSEKLRITSGGYTGIGTTSPSEKLSIWGGNASVVDPTDLGSEMLTNGALTSGTGWTATNDCTLASDKATWTYAAGTASLLYQTLAVAGARPSCGSRWYKFVYTVSGVSGTPTAAVTTNFAAASTALTISNGTQTTYIWSNANPFSGAFAITSTLIAGQTFSLDDLSLKEVMGGDVTYEGLLYTNGASQITRIIYLADDETWILPTGVVGILDVWSKNEYMRVHVSDDGTITSIYGSTNTAITDSDGDLCVYDGGTGAIIKNRRGGEITVGYKYVYSQAYEAWP